MSFEFKVVNMRSDHMGHMDCMENVKIQTEVDVKSHGEKIEYVS